MVTEKQERTVIHLEIDAEHHYYGSVKVYCTTTLAKRKSASVIRVLQTSALCPTNPISISIALSVRFFC